MLLDQQIFDLSNYIYVKNLIFNMFDFGLIGFSDFGRNL